MESEPLVSVIIPSIGKESLSEAISSVLRQTYSKVEVVVRVDPRAPTHAGLDLPNDPRIRLVRAQSHEAISVSRDRALADCTGTLVAYLDDDDRFLEQKLEIQVAAATRALSMGFDHAVVACRVAVRDSFGITRVAPRTLKGAQQGMADYLFRRRQVRPGGTGVGASMVLCDTGLARALAQDTSSSLHEDWEWAIRADDYPNTSFIMLPDILAQRTRNPEGTSASTQADWRVSAQWVTDHRSMLSSRCQSDFLLCITLPLAVSQHDRAGAATVVWRALVSGLPGLNALIFAVLYISLPPRVRRWATATTRFQRPSRRASK